MCRQPKTRHIILTHSPSHITPSILHVTTHPYISPLTLTLTCHHSPSHVTTHPHLHTSPPHPYMSPLTLTCHPLTLTCHHSPLHVTTHPQPYMSALTCHHSPSPSHVTTHPYMSPLTLTLTCQHSHVTTHPHPHMSPLTLTLTCHHSPSPSPLTSPAAPAADSATVPLLLVQTRGHSPTAEEAREVDGTAGQLQENTLLVLSVGKLPHTAAHWEIPLHVIYISGKAPYKGNMSRVNTSM